MFFFFSIWLIVVVVVVGLFEVSILAQLVERVDLLDNKLATADQHRDLCRVGLGSVLAEGRAQTRPKELESSRILSTHK